MLLRCVDAALFEGLLPVQSTGDFAEFIGKFCFDYDKNGTTLEESQIVGTLEWEVMNEGGHPLNLGGGKLYVLLFDDERSAWKKAQKTWANSTCEEKRQSASLVSEISSEDIQTGTLHPILIQERLRPRFWYFTIVGCGLELNHDFIRYKLHATNELWGWQKEISLDHINLFYVYLGFTICFCMSGMAAGWVSIMSPAAQDPPLREHPYIQFLVISYSASALSCIAFLIHYGMFVHNGYGSLRIRFLGVFFGIAANCVLYLMSMLASCGWAINNAALPYRRYFLALISVIGAVQGLCELHAETTITQSTQIFTYAGSVGALMVVLKIFVFLWFAFQVRNSYLDELDGRRQRFYKYLGFGIGVWAITIPVTVLLAFKVNPWLRYKVVASADLAARFVALSVMTQIFCGPLSPLSSENIFSLRHMRESPVACSKSEWTNLDDGERGSGPLRF